MNIKFSSDNAADMAEMFAAFAKAQAGILHAHANSDGGGFKYADLSNVLSVLRKPFVENDLGVVQMPHGEKVEGVETQYLTTIITHKSGQYIQATMPMPFVTGADGMAVIQQLGSAITYLRRYMLSAMAGVAQVDDENELIPDIELAVKQGDFDINQLKDQGIEQAKLGRAKYNAWYEGLGIKMRAYLSGVGADVLESISSHISDDAVDDNEVMFDE